MLRTKVSKKEEWDEVYHRTQPHREVEALLGAAYRDAAEWHLYGYCDVCLAASRFRCDWASSDGSLPNYRERLSCETCKLNCRQRLVLSLLRDVLADRPSPTVYAYEQATPLYRELVSRFSAVAVTGSEYLGPDIPRGTFRDSIRHEDALGLSFPDATFDAVVSSDVYEHVPDILLALREADRVLRHGGKLIATVPFTFRRNTHQRARLENGRIEHVSPPEYHGNPLSERGSLVFYDFGWDLFPLCIESGFSDPHFLYVHSMMHAYLGEGLVLLATKGLPR